VSDPARRGDQAFPGAEAEAGALLDAYLARADTASRLAQIAE
jgi:hypothetical protein